MKSLALLLLASWGGALNAQPLAQDRQNPDRSPLHRAHKTGDHGAETAQFPDEMRTIDGQLNNLRHSWWGAAEQPMLRLVAADYADGLGTPAGVQALEDGDLCEVQLLAEDGSLPLGVLRNRVARMTTA